MSAINRILNLFSPTTRRVQRVRHELKRREVQVQDVQTLSPGFVSITFGDESLADFASDSFDDHIKFMFQDARGETVRRDYTPRRFDRAARSLTIEFALHGQGAAFDWARQAKPGDRALVAGPRGSLIVPTDYAWHLLAGDDSALPALHRRLEELPAGTQALVVAQVDPADRRALASAAKLQLQWVDDAAGLLAALRALPLPAGDGYVWCAGEAQVMARVRDLMLRDKGHPREALRVAAYWKQGASDFHEDLA